MRSEIELPEKLDTASAEALYRNLSEKTGADLCIDANRVRGIGGLPAQVLLAARRKWQSTGHVFEIRCSDAMKQDLVRMGLDQEILMQGEQT